MRGDINDKFIADIETGWTANFKGDKYHLFNEREDQHGNKEFDAVLDFFHHFNGRWHMDDVDDKSMTIDDSIRPLFDDSPYVLSIIDNFYANTMNYSKQQNSTERFLYFIGRHNAEFNIPIGTQTVQIRNKIGVQRNDVFIHEDDNLVDFNITTDTGSFCTTIEYYYDFKKVDGDDNEKKPTKKDVYRSPMADKYGEQPGEPIYDERFSIKENARLAAKQKQEATWKSSFEISAELFDVPLGIGDEVRFVVPSKSINGYIRVVEINEQFDEDGELIEATYTFGNENIANSYRNMQYESIQDLHDLMLGKRKLPYNVLPNAVREATAVINAGESSSFEYRRNGIYGFNTENPLGVTRYNANGIGFSQDGGQTFENALTYLGLTASAITTGSMTANRIHGGVLTSINSNTTFNLNDGHLHMENTFFELGGGARIRFTSPGNSMLYSLYDSSSGYARVAGFGVGNSINQTLPFAYFGTYAGANMDTLGEHYSGFFANTTTRIRDNDSANSVMGRRFRLLADQDYSDFLEFDMFGTNTIKAYGTWDIGEPGLGFRRAYINNARSSNDFFNIVYAYDGSRLGYRFELTSGASAGNAAFRPEHGGELFYNLGTSTHVWRIGYINVLRYNVLEQNSLREFKEEIRPLDVEDAKDYIKNTGVKTFYYKDKNEERPRTLYDLKVGIIHDDIDLEKDYLIRANETSVDQSNITFMIQSVVKDNLYRLDTHETRLEKLEHENKMLKAEIKQLKGA